MTEINRRQTQRQDALNLLDYRTLGAGGDVVLRGLGRTLNVGERGLLLETHQPLTAGETVRITLELKEVLVDLDGRVVRVEAFAADSFHAGIEFEGLDAAGRRTLDEYLAAFKKNYGG